MTLSGNLSFVPIDEVLRLLTRSRQQGSVDVFGSGLSGRIFVGKGGIDLATIWDDENLHRHLVNSGAADVDALRRITERETTLAAISESNKEIVDLVREVTVESIFQMADRGDSFEVREGVTTPYASPKSFELEALISDSRDRHKAWEKVREHVPDLTGAVSFRRDLGERDEVTVKADAWKVLSEIGSGASVQEIADQLGTTEFWAARIAARLLQDDLIDLGVAMTAPAATYETLDEPVEESYAGYVEDYDEPDEIEATTEPLEVPGDLESTDDANSYDDAYEAEVEDGVEATEEAADEAEVEDTSVETEDSTEEAVEVEQSAHSESWWQEPSDEVDEADDAPRTPEVVGEGLSAIPAADTDVEGDDKDVEEDTEAFLEKVFSELESNEPEAEEGHGLLRRRRMGSLRDFSSDS